MKPYVVVFAGVPGTSKTPISNYLSLKFKLPIINTDQIRYEVREDLRINVDSIAESKAALEEFEKRLKERTKEILNSGHPFIFDGSMDRKWAERREQFIKSGYSWFMVSMELSKPFLKELYVQTGRSKFVEEHLDNYLKQHQEFLKKYENDISVKIADKGFSDRLEIAAEALAEFSRQLP